MSSEMLKLIITAVILESVIYIYGTYDQCYFSYV